MQPSRGDDGRSSVHRLHPPAFARFRVRPERLPLAAEHIRLDVPEGHVAVRPGAADRARRGRPTEDASTTRRRPSTTAARSLGASAFAREADLIAIAVAAADLAALAAALKAAGLVETLTDEGPFTVYAPTDAAVAALPEGALDASPAGPEALAAVLTSRVVPGEAGSADLPGRSVASLA